MCRNRDGSQHHATGESSIEMSLLGNLSDTNHNVGKWAISTTINQQTKVSIFFVPLTFRSERVLSEIAKYINETYVG